MATRLYFRNTTATEPKPNLKQAATSIQTLHWLTSTLGGGQDGTEAIYPCDMLLAAGASNATITKTITEPGVNPHYGWVKAFISPPLAAQTISGTFSLVADYQEASVTRNLNPRIFIYVWKADDSGKYATNLYAETTSTLEANTTIGTLQTFTFASYTLSNLVVSEGDRIVIELMTHDANALTTSAIHGFGLNGAVASGYESYIEFSMDMAWKGVLQTISRDQGITVNDKNDTANYYRLKKKFVMRFGNNAGRPKQGITIAELNSGAVARLKKKFIITFKNPTAGASRGRQGLTISAVKSKSKLVRKLTQAIKVTGLASIVPGGQTFARVCVENLVSGWGGVRDVLVRKKLVRRLSQGFTLSINVLTIGPPSVLSVVCNAYLKVEALLKTYRMIRIVLVLSPGTYSKKRGP